jgi:hypothetical protein
VAICACAAAAEAPKSTERIDQVPLSLNLSRSQCTPRENRLHQWLRGKQGRLHSLDPRHEISRNWSNLCLPVRTKRVARQLECSGSLFYFVHGRDEAAPLNGELRLGGLGVPELAAAVGVAAGLDDATGGKDTVEAVLGVRGEGAAERRELRDDRLAALTCRRSLGHG